MNDNANNPFIEDRCFRYSTKPTHTCHLELEILTNSYDTEWLEEATKMHDDFDARINRICQCPVMRYQPIITLSAVPEERRDIGSLFISYVVIAGKDGFSSDMRDKIIGEFQIVAYNLATHVDFMTVRLQIDGINEFYYRR